MNMTPFEPLKSGILAAIVAFKLLASPLANAEFAIETRLTHRISDAIEGALNLGEHEIEIIQVGKSNITLRGKVSDEKTRNALIGIARDQRGVLTVRDELTLDTNLKPVDLIPKIKDQMRARLTKPFTLSISLTPSEINLAGEVATSKDIELAVIIAKSFVKDRTVVANVTIKPKVTDSLILQRIRSALESPPEISVEGVEITVVDGIVSVTGGPISSQRTIDELLSRILMVDGIKDLKNQVKVNDKRSMRY